MGLCCCKQSDVIEPSERTRLIKDAGSGAGGRSGSLAGQGSAYKETQALDEVAVLQTILDTTANDLIDVNRVTAGVQLCKRDYVERENQYKMSLNQHTSNARANGGVSRAGAGPVASAATRDPDSLLQLLAAPSQAQGCSDWLNTKAQTIAASVHNMAVETRGEFVVKLEPLA